MKKKENKDETRAKEYLQTLNFNHIEHEPLGNVTPDFLIDKKIAIEVRRLNRNFINSKKILNIENLEIAVVKKIKKMADKFTLDKSFSSAYVSIELFEPIEHEKKINIIRRVKKILNKHSKHITQNRSYKVGSFLKLTFTPTDKKTNTYIYSGCNGDFFWIIHELKKTIQKAIDEKDKKIQHNYKLYDKWWLILVDSIVHGLVEEDFIKLQNMEFSKQKFHKIIILSAKGKFRTLEF